METDFKFPDVGEGITEGVLVVWKVSVGDYVKEDQIIAEIETDKAVVEMPSPTAGEVVKLHFEEEETIKVGDVLVSFNEKKESGPLLKEEQKEDLKEEKRGEKRRDSGTVVGVLEEAEETENDYDKGILPMIRRLAADLKVDIQALEGTGLHGRITEEDVRHAALVKRPGVRRDHDDYGVIIKVPFRGRRKTIAVNMSLSQQKTAPVTHMDEVDMTELVALKEKERKTLGKKGDKLTFLPFIVKAVVIGLKGYSVVNSELNEANGEIILKKYFNIGIGVDTKDGLIVPVIRDADQKSIIRLAGVISDMAESARNRSLDVKELKGGTFSITNIGTLGGTYSTPVIFYPQAAILATGMIREKPVVMGGEVVVRKIMPVSLTFDHRIMDGGVAARFMNLVKIHLEDPGMLLLELK